MANEAYKPLKLSLMAASREFGMSRNTLRVKLSDTEPDANGCYTIAQLIAVTQDDSKALKDATEKERGEWYRLRNQKFRGELIDRTEIEKGISLVVAEATQVVRGSSLPRKDQDDFLEEVDRLKTVLDTVAAAQAREMGLQKNPENPDESTNETIN